MKTESPVSATRFVRSVVAMKSFLVRLKERNSR